MYLAFKEKCIFQKLKYSLVIIDTVKKHIPKLKFQEHKKTPVVDVIG